MGWSQHVMWVTFQLRLLDLATRGRLLLIKYDYLLLVLKNTITIKKNLQTDLDSILGDSGCNSVPVIPVAIPAGFAFQLEFQRNRNHNLAGTTAKIPFRQNSQNPAGIHGGL